MDARPLADFGFTVSFSFPSHALVRFPARHSASWYTG